MDATAVLAWGGPVVHAAAWVAVRAGRSIWLATAAVLGPVGVAALLLGPPRAADRVGVLAAAGIGAGAGAALYGATAAFMFAVRRWPLLARQASSLYQRRETVPLAAGVALASLVVAPGEELLWRGVVLEQLVSGLGQAPEAVAALVGWGAYVAVNAISRSVPILLGAAVGGAAWAALAVVTGGVVAPILSHGVWTALMIVLPPVFAPRVR